MSDTSNAQDLDPLNIEIKKEVEDEDGSYEMSQLEPTEFVSTTVNSVKWEHGADNFDIPSSSTTFEVKQEIKEEILSDEECNMDFEQENQELIEQDIDSDESNSAISISENFNNIKQELTPDEYSDERNDDDNDMGDYNDDEVDVDDEEEEEEDPNGINDTVENMEAIYDLKTDPLRKCLNILKKDPYMILEAPEIAVILLLLIRRKIRRRNQEKLKKRPWTISSTSEKAARLKFEKKFSKRRQNPNQFLSDFNMTVKTFDELLEKISKKIKRKDTNMRYAISPAERLAVTLRCLTSGYSYNQLLEEFNMGKTTISSIVKTTTEIIWQELKDEYMPQPKEADWLEIADKFYEKTHFPNCLGSICSKYIKIIVPWSKRSEFDRRQKHCATALLAIVGPDMNFIDISVGVLGNSNDNFLAKSTIGQKITKDLYNLPNPKAISGPDAPQVPYVFASKESLNVNIMKPFSKVSDEGKAIFNQQLEKVHDISETCLNTVAYKWRVLRRGILHYKCAEATIKTVCILHNYILQKEGINFNENERFILEGVPGCGMRGSGGANQVRGLFANHFISPQCSVSLQCHSQYTSDKVLSSKAEMPDKVTNKEGINVNNTCDEADDTNVKGIENNKILKSDFILEERKDNENTDVGIMSENNIVTEIEETAVETE